MPHLSVLKLTLAIPSGLEFSASRASSLGPYLQGALMETIDGEYAERLHHLSFNPYSQRCTLSEDNKLVWRISALDDSAYQKLLVPMMSRDSVRLKALDDAVFPISGLALETSDLKELTDLIVDNGPSKLRVRFVTPTSFKSAGLYVFMPSVRLVFQNLFMRYLYVYENSKELDEGTLEYICEHVHITSYNLHSEYFDHAMGNKGKVPAFVGTIGLSVRGSAQLGGLCRMLLKFGEYSGVGIKTSMGMGGLQCLWTTR